MNTQKQIFLIVVLFFMFTGGCAAYAAIDLPVRADTQKDYQYSERVERGALLFANNCRTCHGIKGEGFVGLPLNGADRVNANMVNFQDQDPLILAANQALIRRTLQCGRAGTLMPAWLKDNGGSLSAIQIDHLVELLTSPADTKDADGNPTSEGWLEAVDFAHNLNAASLAVVGGDTLLNVAKAHGIGPQQVYDFNNGRLKFQKGQTPGVNALLERDSTVLLPTNKDEAKPYSYQIRQDNETIAKISDSQNIGAIIIADLNNIPYTIDHARATFTLVDSGGKAIPGMLPGITLALPDGATYTVVSGNTLDSIAKAHNLSATDILALNKDILPSNIKTSDVLDSETKLTLPTGTGVIVQTGDTLAAIAAVHGLVLADFATLNGVAADSTPVVGATLKLPDAAKYTVQTGDTLAKIAASHGLTADALNAANTNLAIKDVNAAINASVVLKMPKIDKYIVAGQGLADVAKGYGNVTADRLAQVNNIASATTAQLISTNLKLPPETYGAAPPDAKNPGTACVQHAVPDSAFALIPGIAVGTPVATPTAPATASKTVSLQAHADDWTITADGTAQAANKGVVLISKGSTIPVTDASGVHTVTLNGTQQGDNLNVGDNRTLTFNDTGTFTITCNFHADMKAYVYVQ